MDTVNTSRAYDFRVVKVEQRGLWASEWAEENKIDSCGVFYLIDASLHIHICSLTPCLEAWSLVPFVTFSEGVEDEDGGKASEIEYELMSSETNVSYFGTQVLDSCPSRPLSDYIDIPEREEDEDDERYRERVADEAREYLQGNPCWF